MHDKDTKRMIFKQFSCKHVNAHRERENPINRQVSLEIVDKTRLPMKKSKVQIHAEFHDILFRKTMPYSVLYIQLARSAFKIVRLSNLLSCLLNRLVYCCVETNTLAYIFLSQTIVRTKQKSI